MLHCKAIPSGNNLSYNLNTLAANCAQCPDYDFLVENVCILTFYQTFSLLLIIYYYFVAIETQFKPSGSDNAGRPNSAPQSLDDKTNKVNDATCDNSERKISDLKSDFIENTTLHGLRHAFKGNTPYWLRLMWLVLLLTSASYYLSSVFDGIEKYFNYPISTVITTKFPGSMDFPAVTICPLNLLQKSKIMMSEDDPEFKKLSLNLSACEVTSAVRNGRPCGHALLCCCSSLMLFANASSLVENCTEDYANQVRSVIEITPSILNLTKYFEFYSQNIEDLLVSCQFGADAHLCYPSDFKQIVTDFGACYTFNSKQAGFPLRKTQFGGAAAGLTLVLDIDVLQHTVGRLSDGFRILVHGQGEYTSIWNGIDVQAGTSASIAISMQKVSMNSFLCRGSPIQGTSPIVSFGVFGLARHIFLFPSCDVYIINKLLVVKNRIITISIEGEY